MASTGSISINASALLSSTSTGAKIDSDTVVDQLMTAAAVPQGQLYDQLTAAQLKQGVFQTINTKLTSLQTAAQAVTDFTVWTAKAASSSDPSVVAASTGTPVSGGTAFDVLSTATVQVSTLKVVGSSVFAGSNTAMSINGTQIVPPPASGAASDVASAINAANAGVKAVVIHTDQGDVLQLTATTTGAADGTSNNGSFTLGGDFAGTPQNVVQAADAVIAVGDTASGGYTVSSHTNTFVDAIPGVTFTVSKPATGVTIGVSDDTQTLSDKIQALVNAANTAQSELANDVQQGSPLQGTSALNSLLSSLGFSVSQGTSAPGGSLFAYGIDIDKNGVFSFDATKFASAYESNPDFTKTAMTEFAQRLADTADQAVNPVSGSITATLNEITETENNLNDSIDAWTIRLQTMKDSLTSKFIAMQTMLARLDSVSTYLTTTFEALNNSKQSR